MATESFIFYLRWKRVLEKYDPEVRHEVFDAILEYVETRTVPELKPLAAMAFSFIQYDLDISLKNYDEKRAQCSRAGKKSHTAKEPKADAEAPAVAPSKPAVAQKPKDDYKMFLDQFFDYSRKATLEALCASMHTDLPTMRRLAKQCVAEWQASEHRHRDFNDAASHLISHIRKKLYAPKPADRESSRMDLLSAAADSLADAINS